MLRHIHLHGALAEKFGEYPYEVDIATPAEAVRALSVLQPGFRQELRHGSYHVLLKHGERFFDIGEEDLALQMGKASEVHFIPVIEGGKNNSGILKIVLGLALVAGAFFLAPAAAGGLGASALSFGGMGVTYGQIAMIGVGLAVAGAAQLLAPETKSKKEKDDKSYIASPSENTVAQGSPVPIVLGRYMVGSVVMSVGISTEQIGSSGIKYPGQG